MRTPAAQQGQRDARILIVDDDDASRYAKGRVLRQAGYRVGEAGSGQDALRRIAEENPDLILLDVRLPDMSGLEVCRRIKEDPRTASVPVLQMSATFRDAESKVAGLEGGADGYLTDPVEPTLLVATVAAFLRLRRAEQAVREHALEWQTTFDAITDGVALLDREGRLRRFNRALPALLNRLAAELAGAAIDELFPPGKGEAAIWGNVTAGGRQQTERSAGERRFGISLDPVPDGRHSVRGAVCIICDITERKLIDERLWHTQKLESIGLLAGGVAHDFNNLLMGILGNASLGLELLSDAQATERVFRDIVRAGERAADLTRQLLAYAGKGKIVVQNLDLSSLVRGTLPLAKASFPGKVKLALRLAGDLPAVTVDKTQIEQVIMNLLINAAEAIGERGGTVTVTTRVRHLEEDERRRYLSDGEVRGWYVMLEIRDDGAGMDEETVRQIFDPFFTTKFMGRGLGLSAVLGIVRSHKGAIRVSSAPGQGSTFELLFPSAAAAAETETAAPVKVQARRGGGTVLVVDDEQIVRDFFKSALELHGYKVVLACDGAEALRLFSAAPERFSLVLLDLVMPVMSGKDVLPRLLELRPESRVVVTSGQVEEEVRHELREWKIAGFIQKPCPVKEFLEKMNAFAGTKVLARG